jgi:hypothetical protein
MHLKKRLMIKVSFLLIYCEQKSQYTFYFINFTKKSDKFYDYKA